MEGKQESLKTTFHTVDIRVSILEEDSVPSHHAVHLFGVTGGIYTYGCCCHYWSCGGRVLTSRS